MQGFRAVVTRCQIGTKLTNMVNSGMEFGVAEAKARFSELLTRVVRGERFVISRRGAPIAGLIPADRMPADAPATVGLAAVAGALADEDDMAALIDEVIAGRQRARDRSAPDLG
jgi:prevent-host-death family protein